MAELWDAMGNEGSCKSSLSVLGQVGKGNENYANKTCSKFDTLKKKNAKYFIACWKRENF